MYSYIMEMLFLFNKFIVLRILTWFNIILSVLNVSKFFSPKMTTTIFCRQPGVNDKGLRVSCSICVVTDRVQFYGS